MKSIEEIRQFRDDCELTGALGDLLGQHHVNSKAMWYALTWVIGDDAEINADPPLICLTPQKRLAVKKLLGVVPVLGDN